MSYLKAKSISVDKEAKVCKIYCASNNLTPMSFGWTEYFSIRDLLPEISGGSIQLYHNLQNIKISNLVYSYNKIFKDIFNMDAWKVIYKVRDVEGQKERCTADLENTRLNKYFHKEAKYWLDFLNNEDNIKFVKEMEEKFVEDFLNLIKRGKKRTDI